MSIAKRNVRTCVDVLESRCLFTATTPTPLTVLLRGQSNANLFGGEYQYYDFNGARSEAETLLGYPAGQHYINVVATAQDANGNNTINSGTAFIGDWVSPNGSGGWVNDKLENGIITNITAQPAAVKSVPAAVVWLHNEYDSSSPTLNTADWVSAVRYDAAQVRTAFGQTAATVPYLFINAIPYSNGRDPSNQAIKVGMQQLSDDASFNAKIAAQFSDVNMDYAQDGTYGGPHMDSADGVTLRDRLAYAIANTFAQYALAGSPIANADGHLDQLGPQVVQATIVAGHANQLSLKVSLDGATALKSTLDADAAAGVGWALVNSAGVKTKATAAQVVDATHITLTFAANVPTDGSVNLNYNYGVGRTGTSSTDPGEGNAIYDNYSDSIQTQGFPVWTIATGVPINGTAQQPETARVHGVIGTQSGTTPTIATAPTASPSTVTGTTTTLNVLGADTGPGGEAGLTYTWSTTSAPSGAPAVTYNATNGLHASRNIGAIFHAAGAYVFAVTISNGSHQVVGSTSVSVTATATSLSVTPNPVTVATNATKQFAASLKDQFGNAMTATYTWSMQSGGGSINASGLYTAPASAGSAVVKAVSGAFTGTAAVTISTAAGPSGLPAGWTNTNIGTPAVNGSASSTGLAAYTVTGAGDNMTGTSDQFDFAAGTTSGNRTLIARITGVSNTSALSAGGVMLRDSTASDAAFVQASVEPDGTVLFTSRNSDGATVSSNGHATTGVVPSASTPIWVKVVRNGGANSAYYALGTATPTTWTQIGGNWTVTFANTNYLAGLSVCSTNTAALATVVYDNVNLI